VLKAAAESEANEWWVVMIHYGDLAVTERALRSIASEDFGSQRLIIMNNGPRGLPVVPEWLREQSQILGNGENLGYAAAANWGAREAFAQGAQWVLLLNNDIRFTSEFFQKLRRAGQRNGVGLASPTISWDDASGRIWYSGSRINWWTGSFAHRTDSCQGESRQADFATGCALAISRECYESCGLYRDELRFYYEDADLSLRARQAGFQVVCWSEARIYHTVSGVFGANSKERTPAEKSYYCSRNLFWIGKSHLAPTTYRVCAAVWAGKFFMVALAQALRGRVRKALRTLAGVCDGLRGGVC
jgi:hypothetical protein